MHGSKVSWSPRMSEESDTDKANQAGISSLTALAGKVIRQVAIKRVQRAVTFAIFLLIVAE